MKNITIAIDGYSSCGKSTVARALAVKLGYVYVDSGAMYRAVTLYALHQGIIKDGVFVPADIVKLLDDIHLEFQSNPHTKTSTIFLNGENIEDDIRQMVVSENVSRVSPIPEVRSHMITIQRKLGEKKGIVMDGRDIGTRVFPNAELKIFLTADVDTRVERRYNELLAAGHNVTLDEVKANLIRRDHEDTHREESPLRQAADAILLDNTHLNRAEQLEYILGLIEKMNHTDN